MRLEYHDAALRDVLEPKQHYRSQNPAAALRFEDELDAAIAAILAAPKRSAIWRRGMRRFLMRKFPFAICYIYLSPDLVRIVIVRHHSQRRGFGTRRK